jgi:signal transduction histidine kinase
MTPACQMPSSPDTPLPQHARCGPGLLVLVLNLQRLSVHMWHLRLLSRTLLVVRASTPFFGNASRNLTRWSASRARAPVFVHEALFTIIHMTRLDGTSANRRLCWPQRMAAWAALAGLAPARAADAATTPISTTLAAALFALALAALALAVGAVLALRAANARRDEAEELRALRARDQAIEQLLDVWLWHTDAAHRLVAIRPPQGAAARDWSLAQTPAPLWECFKPDAGAALEARLGSGAPLDDVPVVFAGAEAGLLRGRAVADASGRFAGYHGTWRPHPSAAPAAPVAPKASTASSAAAAEHDSFGYTVSHDLRAPIRVVEGFTRIVKEDYGRLLDRVGNEHLDRVLGAAARMNNMIDALLALSKLSSQPLARQPVNLTQLAGFVADDLRRQSPDRDVRIEIEPGLHVQGDPTLLRIAIENLLGNAWKYTGKTGSASISVARHARDADTFSVSDNGAGFDMRFADRLFGVFQRLHSANDFPGTGIGLASVRRIVRRHGGEIWGEAEVNRGARFHFTLPQGTAGKASTSTAFSSSSA